MFLLVSPAFAGKHPKVDPRLKTIPLEQLAATCHYEQYEVLPGGFIRYTYMRCLNRAGEMELWKREADAQRSLPREIVRRPEEMYGPATPPLIQIPTKPTIPEPDDDPEAVKAGNPR